KRDEPKTLHRRLLTFDREGSKADRRDPWSLRGAFGTGLRRRLGKGRSIVAIRRASVKCTFRPLERGGKPASFGASAKRARGSRRRPSPRRDAGSFAALQGRQSTHEATGMLRSRGEPRRRRPRQRRFRPAPPRTVIGF